MLGRGSSGRGPRGRPGPRGTGLLGRGAEQRPGEGRSPKDQAGGAEDENLPPGALCPTTTLVQASPPAGCCRVGAGLGPGRHDGRASPGQVFSSAAPSAGALAPLSVWPLLASYWRVSLPRVDWPPPPGAERGSAAPGASELPERAARLQCERGRAGANRGNYRKTTQKLRKRAGRGPRGPVSVLIRPRPGASSWPRPSSGARPVEFAPGWQRDAARPLCCTR